MNLRTLAVCVLFAAGCDGVASSDPADLGNGQPIIRVSHDGQALSAGASDAGLTGVDLDDSFYLAINVNGLGSRWFLSAFLSQWDPEANTPVRSLGTRVVSFKVQNGKLFVFDVSDSDEWSDTLDPTIVLEAYPIVTDFAPFNALDGSAQYVLFDPAAGLNHFSFVSDDIAASYDDAFTVDLSFSQRFRTLADGISYDQVFSGTSAIPAPGVFEYAQPFRAAGTLGIALRRYQETPGYTAMTMPTTPFYFQGAQVPVPNTGTLDGHRRTLGDSPGDDADSMAHLDGDAGVGE